MGPAPAFISSSVQAGTMKGEVEEPKVSVPAAKGTGLDNAAFSSMLGRAEEKAKMAATAPTAGPTTVIVNSGSCDKCKDNIYGKNVNTERDCGSMFRQKA